MSLEIDRNPRIAFDFRQSLRACTRCDLHEGCIAPVPWAGGQDVEFAVVGEAPGASEAKAGEPFIGPSGVRLKYLLRKVGIDPSKAAFLNAVQCWPKRGLNPNSDRYYVDTCRSWMRGQISFIRPKYVITVGVVAYYSVTGRTWPKLREMHGKPLFWNNPPVPAKPAAVWCTYHPSAALRSKKYQDIIERDLIAFKEWREGGEVWPESCYVCGEELYRYDGQGVGLCERHSLRQGLLWEEEGAME